MKIIKKIATLCTLLATLFLAACNGSGQGKTFTVKGTFPRGEGKTFSCFTLSKSIYISVCFWF